MREILGQHIRGNEAIAISVVDAADEEVMQLENLLENLVNGKYSNGGELATDLIDGIGNTLNRFYESGAEHYVSGVEEFVVQ